MSAGFVSFYLTNRTVFIINFVVCCVALIHSFVFIWRTQTQLESQQLLIGLVAQKEEDQQFPICSATYASQPLQDRARNNLLMDGTQSESDIEAALNDENKAFIKAAPMIAATESHTNKWYKMPRMSGYEWFMLSSIVLINSTVAIFESVVVIYYPLYVVQQLNANVIIGTCGVVVISAGFGIGNLIVPRFDWNGQSLIRNTYFVMGLCLVAMQLHMLYLFPVLRSVSLYWIYDFTVGLLLGVMSMTSETILLEIQPTKDSGKISGAKGFIRNLVTAIASAVVTFFWNATPNSMYYVMAASFGIALLLTLTMSIAKYMTPDIHINTHLSIVNI
eukprot:84194_1